MVRDAPRRRVQLVTRHFQAGVRAPAKSLTPATELGTFRLGPHVAIPVHAADAPERVPPTRLMLDTEDPIVLEHLEFLGKKWQLRQDVFLSSPPGPYARRLCQTFAALIQVPVEYVSLHRDIGEAELLQQRSLEAGGNLRYDDGPVVRAMKHGRLLILDGIERAERGVSDTCSWSRVSSGTSGRGPHGTSTCTSPPSWRNVRRADVADTRTTRSMV